MAYATITDVFARYKPIGSMVGAGSLDTTSVDVASIYISDAEGIINAHLASRYVVPVTTEPLVTMLSSDLAISAMLLEKLGSQPPFMESRYNRAMDLLSKLSEGTLLLVASGTTNIQSGDNEAWSTTGSYHPVFSPVLEDIDQSVDVDYVNAENDVRENDG
jgi:phage gp36-like protein